MENSEIIRLSELVRQGERLLDHQLRIASGEDEKSRHLIATSTAFLTATAALVGFAAATLPLAVQIPLVASLACALGFLGWALVLFSHAYLGSRSRPARYEVGWNPKALITAADVGDDVGAVHRSTLLGLQKWFRRNEAIMERAGERRRRGVNALMAAGAFLGEALIYMAVTNGQ